MGIILYAAQRLRISCRWQTECAPRGRHEYAFEPGAEYSIAGVELDSTSRRPRDMLLEIKLFD